MQQLDGQDQPRQQSISGDVGASGSRPMKVLVTGATGFIGEALTRRLVAAGHQVRVLARQPEKVTKAGLSVQEIHQGDITDVTAIGRAVSGAELVYAIAGTFREPSLSDERYREVNVAAVRYLMEAAKRNGGIVIAQVLQVVQNGTLHPKQVKVPGILVDHVVVGRPENHMQTMGTQYNRAFAGDIRVPVGSLRRLPLDERKIIARRAAVELGHGAIVNLGIGVPAGIASIAAEEGVQDLMALTLETGPIGGISAVLVVGGIEAAELKLGFFGGGADQHPAVRAVFAEGIGHRWQAEHGQAGAGMLGAAPVVDVAVDVALHRCHFCKAARFPRTSTTVSSANIRPAVKYWYQL